MMNIGLLGLGNIGLLYDEDLDSSYVRSHAKAIALNPEFSLRYAVDPQEDRRQRIKKIFPEVEVFPSWEPLLKRDDFEILTVCVPTHEHYRCLQAFASSRQLKCIVLEKPAFLLEEQYAQAPLADKIVVNYIRRFSEEIQGLKEKIQTGTFGKILEAKGTYSKGLRNNGSHLIDLINIFFRSPRPGRVQQFSRREDYSPEDPTVSAHCVFQSMFGEFDFFLGAGDERAYSIFELDLLFTNARVRFSDFARTVEIFSVGQDSVNPAYRALSPEPQKISTKLPVSMANLYKHVSLFAKGSEQNISPLSSDRWNQEILSRISAK